MSFNDRGQQIRVMILCLGLYYGINSEPYGTKLNHFNVLSLSSPEDVGAPPFGPSSMWWLSSSSSFSRCAATLLHILPTPLAPLIPPPTSSPPVLHHLLPFQGDDQR